MTTTATATVDGLLGALDQLTNAVYWYQVRHPLNAATALTEAIDDWISEHAAEHHHSQPFTTTTGTDVGGDGDGDGDVLAVVLTHFLAAVTDLAASGARPGLTTTAALTEAIAEWATAQSAEHHHDQPFQRPSGSGPR